MIINKTSIKIDGIDKIILNELISEARTPINKIAVKTGISAAAIHQRIKKLEASNIIIGSNIKLNPKVLGYKTIAFVGIYLDKSMNNLLAVNKLSEIPEILECHYTTGNWSVFIKILCMDNEHLMTLLNTKIQKISGVSRTETFISLDQQILRQIAI
tara:strand:- start:342 stop:812 length:471 start_codon:yes stop_codon:yes gene_type:complete